MLNWRPRGSLSWVRAFLIASYQHLLWTPTHQGTNGPFGLMWLSLPHIVYNSVQSPTPFLCSIHGPYITFKLPRGDMDTPSRLRNFFRYLWNGLSDRHRAEITVMQFTGHSLPVRQSMRVPWEYFYLVPFHQPISAHPISSHNCHWNVSLPSGASPWMAFWAGSKGQNITLEEVGVTIKCFLSCFYKALS